MKTRNGLFADVPENLWNDWHWQVANRAETVEDLKKYMTLTPDEEEGVRKTLGKLRMAVTPYYLSLIDLNDPFDPIRKMAIPRAEELEYADYEDADPLHEDTDSPTPGLTHRYPDRVLLLITDQCSMYCRHCTRRRFAGQNDCEVPMQQIDKCIDYVAAHPEVRDVLLSGGDSLMVSDEVLEYIIKRVRAIPHVEIVRLGSRTPVVCPQRITPELCAMLKKYHPVWLNTHFNTPKEFTPEAAKACAMLADAGIPLGNQSVLLAGVNDCSHVMMELVHGLVKMRVRPYYIYACDPSLGLSHFRTPVSKGIEKDSSLRLTLDREILWRTEALDLRRGAWGTPLLEPGQVLMEIKISNAAPLWLAEALSENGIFPVSFSKCGRAFELLCKNKINETEIKRYA